MITARFETLEDMKQLLYDIDSLFMLEYSDDWFSDKKVVDIATKIDNVEHIKDSLFYKKQYGTFGPESLSSGAKSLILAFKADLSGYYFKLSSLGDNCFSILSEIGNKRDVAFYVDCVPALKDNECKFVVEETGKVISTALEFAKECALIW